MNCWVINRGFGVSCKVDCVTSMKRKWYNYLLTTDQQTMIYNSTIHALKLIYFDSNTQETMKKRLYPSGSTKVLLLCWRILQIFLTVTQTFTCFSYIYYAQKQCLYCLLKYQGNMDDGKDDVLKWQQLASHNSAQWFVTELNTILFHWLCRHYVRIWNKTYLSFQVVG